MFCWAFSLAITIDKKGYPRGGGWKDRLIVSVVCASGGLLSLITLKPDGDDYAYLSSIRFYLDNPNEQLNTKIRGLFGFGEEYASFIWGNANSYEYMHGAFEWFFGLNYLLSYYTLGGVLSGVFSVFAIYYLALRFYPHSQQLIFALSLSILILLFIDETTRTFANLYFLRNFQGKVIVFTVAVPMTIAWSLDYLRKQSSKAWLCLFLLNTASIGLSLTAIFLLPAAGLLTSLYFGITNRYNLKTKNTLIVGAKYWLTYTYLIGFALIYKNQGFKSSSSDSLIHNHFPNDFFGQLELFFKPEWSDQQPVGLLIFIATMTLTILFARPRIRQFAVIYTLLSVIIFFNPISARFLIENITTPNTYWRMFFLWPLPLLVMMAIHEVNIKFMLWKRLTRLFSIALRPTLGLGLVFFVVSSWGMQMDNRKLNRWTVEFLKFPKVDMKIAEWVVKSDPGQVILAPIKNISGIISLISSEHQLISKSPNAVKHFDNMIGSEKRSKTRIGASNFVLLGNESDKIYFYNLLSTKKVDAIVIHGDVIAKHREISPYLVQSNFCMSDEKFYSYIIYSKLYCYDYAKNE